VSSATAYLARDSFAASDNFEAVILLITTLTVQAVPSALTLLLLSRHHLGSGSDSGGTPMLSLPLLAAADDSVAVSSHPTDAVASHHVQAQTAWQLAADNARLQTELREKSAQNSRLQDEILLLRAQVARLQEAK
jgi:hypothetical protein